jgi:hypothetical protein
LHSMGRRLKDKEDRSIFNSTMALKTNGEQDEQGIGNLPESREVEVVREMSRRDEAEPAKRAPDAKVPGDGAKELPFPDFFSTSSTPETRRTPNPGTLRSAPRGSRVLLCGDTDMLGVRRAMLLSSLGIHGERVLL